MKPTEPELDPALPTTVTPSGRVVYDPLKARRVEVDGGAPGDMGKLLAELRALDDDDVRDAVPAPVALSPSSGGALITEEGQDAASAHVKAPVPEPAPAGRVESAPVKIVDPRRAATVRIEKKSPWILDAGTAEPKLDKDALPSATAPSSRTPAPGVTEPCAAADGAPLRTAARTGAGEGASSKRAAAIVVATIVGAGLVVFFLLRAPAELPHESASGGGSVTAPESATGKAGVTGVATSAGVTGSASAESGTTAAPDATGSGSSTMAGAATASPDATGSAPGTTASPAASAKSTAPRTTGDPYGDASSAPKPTASTGPTAPAVTAVPSVSPSAVPAVSSVPATKPATSGTPGPSDTSFVIHPKGHPTP